MVNVEIKITGIRIGNYSIPVPHGLSELINKTSAWSTEKSNLKGYHRKVVKKDGKLMTILTKAG